MKIAITAMDQCLSSKVYPRFGRTPWLLLVDTEAGSEQAIPNSLNAEAAQGAGIQTAQKVAESGAQAVLTGHCGPKAFRTLQAAGVEVYVGIDGPVSDAIERLVTGELTPSDAADKDQHWN